MIWSPNHGDTAFTVPMFDQFMTAIDQGEWVGKEAKESYLCIQLITTAYRSAEDGCRELPLATEVPNA